MISKFTEHPHEVGETYFEHMRHAFGYGCCFLKLAYQSFVHCIFPWKYNGDISGKVCDISDHIRNRID